MVENFVIEESIAREIDHWLSKYPPEQKRSAIVPALNLVQKQNGGWLSEAAMNAVAQYLDLPPIMIYELATFYDMYELKPIGRHKIGICTNLSCQLAGVDKIVDHIQKRCGVSLGETTADGAFTFRELECMAACGSGPMCQVDDEEYHEHLSPEKMDALLNSLKVGEP